MTVCTDCSVVWLQLRTVGAERLRQDHSAALYGGYDAIGRRQHPPQGPEEEQRRLHASGTSRTFKTALAGQITTVVDLKIKHDSN